MRKRKDPESENLTLEESILIERLRSYRVPGMVEEYRKQLQDPNSDLLSFHERFTRLVNAEWNKRYNKKLNDKLKKARLPSLRPSSFRISCGFILIPVIQYASSITSQITTCYKHSPAAFCSPVACLPAEIAVWYCLQNVNF